MSYNVLTGSTRHRSAPAFRNGLTTSPDGIAGTHLRHRWETRSGVLHLTVVGPDPDTVEVEYHRLWAEHDAANRP
ncbi:hypothetical protein [Streptomyces sp. NBC_01477]|uniref:hypothetical protein n=1 Tax=Streptomyces sp. NBC_01477 TaxID=2976015 RepID=UPI002E3113B2|nr:hypothetical protein [Streptomyces sp. NBC_01477]